MEANLCSICYHLGISVLPLDITLLTEEGWNSINRFEVAIILSTSQTRNSMFMLSLIFVMVYGMLEWKWICVVYCLSFVHIAVGYPSTKRGGLKFYKPARHNFVPHPKPEICVPTPYAVVFFVFMYSRWEAIVRLVDIAGIALRTSLFNLSFSLGLRRIPVYSGTSGPFRSTWFHLRFLVRFMLLDR